MAKVNGSQVNVMWGAQTIGSSTSATLNINSDMPSTLTKDDEGWETSMAGKMDWDIDVEGLHNPETTVNDDVLAAAQLQRARLPVIFQTEDGVAYSGLGRIQTFSKTADAEQPVSYSVKIKGDGPLQILPPNP